jgi:alkylated DNA repair dioxygenase AlkB
MTLDPIPIPDGELLYAPSFLTATDADEYLGQFHDGIQWEQHQVKIFGRQVPAPRLSAWYGDPDARYTYSGLALEPLPWTAALRAIKTRIETVTDAHFNSVLLNLYRNGSDSMGWHSDDEPELGNTPTIASLSLGDERRFLLRHKRRKDLDPIELPLQHGSLLLMRGATQTHWKHQVPKTKRPVALRLNLTFRRIIGQGAQ